MALGSPVFGHLGDRFGRKVSVALGSFFITFYGLLSAAAPTFPFLVALRFLVGVYIGSLPQVGPTSLLGLVTSHY